MSSANVRKYLLQDLTNNEYESYLEYVKGNENRDEWIEKASERRELILTSNLICIFCNEWVDVRINGVCTCKNNHKCYNVVIPFLINNRNELECRI